MTLIERAKFFAIGAHSGQVRKYTGEPYINHPAEVAAIVSEVTSDETTIAAAWLHDVVEDCGVSLATLNERFGFIVGDNVYWLTDVSKPADGNRATRKAIDRNHIASTPPAPQTIKLADLISNTSTIVDLDPGFAKIYLKEKKLLLDVLNQAAARLMTRAREMLKNGFIKLGIEP